MKTDKTGFSDVTTDGMTIGERDATAPVSRREFLKKASVAAGAAALLPALPAVAAPLRGPVAEPAPPATSCGCDTADLVAFIEQQRIQGHFPALATAATNHGEIVWSRGFGLANIETGLHATANTPFMLASVSKTVMSVAVMQMWEQGKFGLDDDINALLPFPVRNPNFPSDPITPRQLLTHTSSLRDNWDILTPLYVQGDSPISLATVCHDYFTPGAQYYDAAHNFKTYGPATRYSYCNMGATLAGYLVEAITGTPFDQWCMDNIFTPLGMDNTSWHLAGLDPAKVAMPYRYKPSGYYPYGQYGYPDYPDGQLRTSVHSLAKFLAAFSMGGIYQGTRILQSATVEEMLTSQLGSITSWKQGIIWYQTSGSSAGPLWGHNGGDWGVSTYMFFRRSDLSGAVVLANACRAWGITRAVRDRLINEAASL